MWEVFRAGREGRPVNGEHSVFLVGGDLAFGAVQNLASLLSLFCPPGCTNTNAVCTYCSGLHGLLQLKFRRTKLRARQEPRVLQSC